jgi:hypothetical protein
MPLEAPQIDGVPILANCADGVQPGTVSSQGSRNSRINPNFCAGRPAGIPNIDYFPCSNFEMPIIHCFPHRRSPGTNDTR